MCTVRIVMPWPGTFAPIAKRTRPLVRAARGTRSTFGRSPSEGDPHRTVDAAAALELESRSSVSAAPAAWPHPDVERRGPPQAPVCRRRAWPRRRSRSSSRVRRPCSSRYAQNLGRPRTKPRPVLTAPRPTSGQALCSAFSHLHLLVPHRLGREVDRRLHRRQREQLQQVGSGRCRESRLSARSSPRGLRCRSTRRQ